MYERLEMIIERMNGVHGLSNSKELNLVRQRGCFLRDHRVPLVC